MSRHEKISFLVILLIAIQLGLLVFFAFNRLVDGDEGFYLSAAREVANGRLLYTDFFYPQMPYLPYIFSIFAGNGFGTLFMTRLASVLAALVTTVLFYLVLKRLTSDKTTQNIILALYVFSGLVISWHSVAKTFAWTDMFLMGAFYCLIRFMHSSRLWPLAVCGALMALAVNTRLVLLPLTVLFLIPMVVNSGRQWIKRALAYILPLVVFSLPSLIYLARDTRRFIFDNMGFHFMRNPGVEFPYSIFQKLQVIIKLLANPQLLILMVAAVGAIALWRRTRGEARRGRLAMSANGVAGLAAFAITISYFLPNPVLQQYFVQALPFVLLAITGAVERFVLWTGKDKIPVFRRRLPALLMAVYILGMAPYFVIFIGAVREFDSHSNLGNMKRICASLNLPDEDDPILTELPIISVLSNKPTFDGVEFLGFEYPLPLSVEEKQYYRLILNSQLKEILDSKSASFYVAVNDPPDELTASIAANYQLQDTFDSFRVYRRKS